MKKILLVMILVLNSALYAKSSKWVVIKINAQELKYAQKTERSFDKNVTTTMYMYKYRGKRIFLDDLILKDLKGKSAIRCFKYGNFYFDCRKVK